MYTGIPVKAQRVNEFPTLFKLIQKVIKEFPTRRLINEFPSLFKLVQGLIWEFLTPRIINEFPTLFFNWN